MINRKNITTELQNLASSFGGDEYQDSITLMEVVRNI